MPKYVFIKHKDPQNEFDVSSIKMVIETESLVEILEELEAFFKACGFGIDGQLEIVEGENGSVADKKS